MNTASASKYNINVNPPYQVDWGTAASGKRVSATKRRVRFRFGFSNAQALAQGLAGVDCRGEEHEVGLVWSLTSGKRVVVFDGKEVHFSMGRRGETKFEASFPIDGGHTMKIIAHAAKPMRDIPGFKQFDLLLDGMSYFNMPRIFDLGARRGRAVAVRPSAHQNAYNYNQQYNAEAERRFESNMRRYEQAHDMSGSFTSVEPAVVAPNAFAGPTRRTTMDVAPVGGPAPAVVPAQDVLSEIPRGSDLLAPPAYAPTNVPDEFTPVAVQPVAPTFQDVSNQILSAYGPAPSTPAVPALANEPHTYHQPQQQYPGAVPTAVAVTPQKQQYYGAQPALVSPDASMSSVNSGLQSPEQPFVEPSHPVVEAPQPVAPSAMTMMKPLEVAELRDSPPPQDAMDQAVQNLVNLHDLTEPKMTPEQIKTKHQKEEMRKAEHKSRPLPPSANGVQFGTSASLADIQQQKPAPGSPKKEVMKMHAFDPAAAQAGMMVVYGQPQQQGPPSIPVASGFGAGAYNGYRGY